MATMGYLAMKHIKNMSIFTPPLDFIHEFIY
jgi:hypothetical protein